MTKIIVTIVACFIVFSGKTQTQATSTYGQVPNIMSPEVATLGKYGTYPVSYYTGAVNVSVPLYTIKENDISIDLSLQNSAAGFIPNAEDGVVGLNWNLIAGGVITRQVNMVPDDLNNPNPGVPENGNYTSLGNVGYIYGMLHAHPGALDPNYIQTLQFLDVINPTTVYSLVPYEIAPDIFSFNFNGHTGRFFLGNDGTVKVSSDRNYKVDVSGMGGQTDLKMSPNPSTITITSDEGDIYTFGDTISALQITYPCTPGGTGITGTGAVINAWYLTSIKTHNGRVITFNYNPQTPFALSNYPDFTDPTIDYLYGKMYYNDIRGEVPLTGGSENLSNAGQPPTYSVIKMAYLKSIVTPTTEVDFSYSRKPDEFYGTADPVFDHTKTSQLTGMQIKDIDGNTIKNITMEYTANGNATVGYRNFLHKVNFQDAYSNSISSYQFGYYGTSNLPDPLTKGIDMWGNYNGEDGNASLVPTSSSGPPDFNVTFTGREVNSAFCNMGLLQTVTYPTGGSSQFTYENHDYSQVFRRTVAGGMTPQLISESGPVGGARISQITNSNGVTQSFFYKQNYDPNNPQRATLPSSGILTDNDVFLLYAQWSPNNDGNTVVSWIIQDNNIAASASYGETPIGYSEVTELVSGNGYTKYVYSNQITNPDLYRLGSNSYIVTPGIDITTTNFNQQMMRLVKYSSRDMERGKLVKTIVYNNTSTPLKEIDNQYNTDASRYNQSVIAFNWPYTNPAGFDIYHSYALYYFQNGLTQQTTIEYAPGSSLSSTVNYSYLSNANPLLRSKSETDSKGNTKTVNYTYPGDLSGADPYTTMVNRNMISSIVQQDTYKNGASLLESTKTNFNFWTGTAWDITNTAGLILPQNIQTKTLSQSSYDTRFNYDAYNIQGDVMGFSKPTGVSHCDIWGYHKLYPIAEVTNAAAGQVAYTSFEDDDMGGWTVNPGSTIGVGAAFTGRKAFSGEVHTDVPLGNYVVTLWSNTAGSTHTVNGSGGTAGPVRGIWQLYTYTVNNATHISIHVDNADEVRLYPVGAQMTTYTYDLLVGVTSKTGVDNRTTYYQYDPFGRLFSIKDQDGNILKKYCYNYAGQPEYCDFYLSAAIDNDYLSGSCQTPQYYALPYHVTVPQGKFGGYTAQSGVTQSSVDHQAQQYAQNIANANGACAIADVSFYAEDEVGGGFTITLQNVLSQQQYTLDIEPHGDGSVSVPPGAYNIAIVCNVNTGYFYYDMNCSGYHDEGTTGATFYDIDLSNGTGPNNCNSLDIN